MLSGVSQGTVTLFFTVSLSAFVLKIINKFYITVLQRLTFSHYGRVLYLAHFIVISNIKLSLYEWKCAMFCTLQTTHKQ